MIETKSVSQKAGSQKPKVIKSGNTQIERKRQKYEPEPETGSLGSLE